MPTTLEKDKKSKQDQAIVTFVAAGVLAILTGGLAFARELNPDDKSTIAALNYAMYVVNGLSAALLAYLGKQALDERKNIDTRTVRVRDAMNNIKANPANIGLFFSTPIAPVAPVAPVALGVHALIAPGAAPGAGKTEMDNDDAYRLVR